jgi:hypothetical protein
MKLGETESSFNARKTEFEKLRSDVQIKLKFLDENRVGSLEYSIPYHILMCEYNTLLMHCIRHELQTIQPWHINDVITYKVKLLHSKQM